MALKHTMYWTKQDGTKILVNDMDEEHAKNCLALLLYRIQQKREFNSCISIDKDIAELNRNFHEE